MFCCALPRLVDGTPLLDIKPYLPTTDAEPDATMGWLARTPRATTIPAADQALVSTRLGCTGETNDDSNSRIGNSRTRNVGVSMRF